MFSLIITLISVALVALLSLATIYYGSDSFFKAGEKATASRLTAEAEQLRTAIQMFVVDNNRLPANLQELVDQEYLKDPPANWGSTSQYFTSSNYEISQDVCLQFNTQRGVPFVPECTDDAYRNMTLCCRNTIMSSGGN